MFYRILCEVVFKREVLMLNGQWEVLCGSLVIVIKD